MRQTGLLASVALLLGAFGLSWFTHGTGVIRNDPERHISVPSTLTVPMRVQVAYDGADVLFRYRWRAPNAGIFHDMLRFQGGSWQVAAYAIGLLVWPFEALSASPLGRNHMLAATWTLAYWTLLLIVRWRRGEAVWVGLSRWVMVGLAALGSLLLTITGTLGGHLTGTPTAMSQALRALHWEVYTTFYVPDLTLAALVVIAVVLAGLGLYFRRAAASA